MAGFKNSIATPTRSKLGDGKYQFGDITNGAAYLGANAFASGFLGTFEDIGDTVGGTIAQIFGDEALAKRIYQNRWSDDVKQYLTSGIDVQGEAWETAGNLAGNIGSIITRSALALGIAAATGGVGVGATAGALAKTALMGKTSLGLLGASAYAGAMNEAVNTTGEIGLKENLYSIGSAGVEILTEKMFGSGNLASNGIKDGFLDGLTKGIKSGIIKDFVQEGLEEATSEAINPLLKNLTIDKDAKINGKDIMVSAVTGGVISLILGGGQTVVNTATNTKIGKNLLENGNAEATLQKGLSMDIPFAKKLEAQAKGGDAITPTQYGKLASEINQHVMEKAVDDVAVKYGVSFEKAKEKYADYLGARLAYAEQGASVFTDDQEGQAAITQYLDQEGGDIDDLYVAHKIAAKMTESGKVNYTYDENALGDGFTKNGKEITLNLAFKDKLKGTTAVHEVIHTLTKQQKKDLLTATSGIAEFEEIKTKTEADYKGVYEKDNPDWTKEQIDEANSEEVLARTMEKVVEKPAEFLKAVEGNYTLAEKITNALKSFAKRGEDLTKSEKAKINNAYNLMKSYVEKGKVIPLSERFSKKDDIRWSKRETENKTTLESAIKVAVGSIAAKDFAKRGSGGAGVLKNTDFTGAVESLGKVIYRGKLNTSKVIDAVNLLDKVYRKSFLANDEEGFDFYDADIAEGITDLRQNLNAKEDLTAAQLRTLNNTIQNVLHIYRNYDKVMKDGKRVLTETIAASQIQHYRDLPHLKNNPWSNASFREMFGDPMSVIGFYDGYQDGGLGDLAKGLMEGEKQAAIKKYQIFKKADEFYAKNKGYKKRLKNTKVKLTLTEKASRKASEVEISLQKVMSLYCTARRDQAQLGLMDEGIVIEEKGKRYEYVFADNSPESIIKTTESELTKEDKAFLDVAYEILNECRDLKVNTDMARCGYSNVVDGFYYPIKRDNLSIAIDLSSPKAFVDALGATVGNISANKNTVKGARNALVINDITDVLESHVDAITMYSEMWFPIDTFSRVYNKRILGADGQATSVRREINNRFDGADSYIKKLVQDLQGSRTQSKTKIGKALNWIRQSFVYSALGANAKVFVSQVSSYLSASIYIKPKNMMKALAHKVDKATIYKYSPYLEMRNHDNEAAKAESVSDKLSNIGKFTMKPIAVMDGLTTEMIFTACCFEVEPSGNFTDAVYKKAAKLCEDTIYKTQSTSGNMSRTGMMRDSNEIVKAFTMFSSDATKQFSRIADAIGRFTYATAIKDGTAKKAALKEARDYLIRSLTGVLSSMVAFVLLGLGVKYALGTEDKTKSFIQNAAEDFGGTVTGLMPIVRDVYDYLIDGYEVSNFAEDTINGLASSMRATMKGVESLIEGKNVDVESLLYKNLYTAGQLTGIPTRNITRQVRGIIDKYIK